MLQAIDLTKKFDGFTALDRLNLSVKGSEIFCLLGANGAGKSTTINLFLNFISPTSGSVSINGLDVAQHALKTKSLLTYIPENLHLYPQLTGVENLGFFCGLSDEHFSKESLEEMLTEAGLQEDFMHKRVSQYSKGMRQKVGVALAIAKNAKVLLLDEPTSGLDPQASNEFSELLLKMKDKGVAILMATHDLYRAKDTGTHIGIMKQGKLLKSFPAHTTSHQELEALYLKYMHRTRPIQ